MYPISSIIGTRGQEPGTRDQGSGKRPGVGDLEKGTRDHNFAKIGREACDENHLAAVQLRHLVKSASDVKVVITKEAGVDFQECWGHALCVDGRSGSDHIVKIYRKDAN